MIQYYSLNDLPETDKQMYCLEKTDDVYAMDLFIGETQYWNQGIGTKLISVVVNYLFEELEAVKVVIPQVWNTRAIRCYEKCGFVSPVLLAQPAPGLRRVSRRSAPGVSAKALSGGDTRKDQSQALART